MVKKWLDWTLRDVFESLSGAVENISAGIPIEVKIKEKPKKQQEPPVNQDIVVEQEQQVEKDSPPETIPSEDSNENK